MSRRWWVTIGGLFVVALILFAAVLANRDRAGTGSSASPAVVDPLPSPSPGASSSPSPTAPGPTASPAASGAAPTAAPPAATPPPRATGSPRLAYAEFLLRLNNDRATAERLNGALSTAAQAQDPAAVRTAAVDILSFVDTERDWLREHPPADCYADAHTAAGAMLDAYGTAADSFITWAETGGGFAGLVALGDALDAAQRATDALTAFGTALEATTCPA